MVSALISASSCSWRLVNIQAFLQEDRRSEVRIRRYGRDDRRTGARQISGMPDSNYFRAAAAAFRRSTFCSSLLFLESGGVEELDLLLELTLELLGPRRCCPQCLDLLFERLGPRGRALQALDLLLELAVAAHGPPRAARPAARAPSSAPSLPSSRSTCCSSSFALAESASRRSTCCSSSFARAESASSRSTSRSSFLVLARAVFSRSTSCSSVLVSARAALS